MTLVNDFRRRIVTTTAADNQHLSTVARRRPVAIGTCNTQDGRDMRSIDGRTKTGGVAVWRQLLDASRAHVTASAPADSCKARNLAAFILSRVVRPKG